MIDFVRKCMEWHHISQHKQKFPRIRLAGKSKGIFLALKKEKL
jgi:hypothetical protein